MGNNDLKMSITILVPYFGTLPKTFQLWLNSCKYNTLFNWLIITNDKTMYDYPQNVKVEYMEFADVQKLFASKLGDESLFPKTPYKLCDYRPLFGFLFSDYLMESTHWGYCDLDLIFGNLSKFITQDVLNAFDKINIVGHLSILKNNDEINFAFKKCDYVNVLKNNSVIAFDEVHTNTNINFILIQHGFKVLKTIPYYDVVTSQYCFNRSFYSHGNSFRVIEKYPSIFCFNRGVLSKIPLDSKHEKEELPYVHFQKRNMDIECDDLDCYFIVPNKFIDKRDFTKKDFKSFGQKRIAWYLSRRFNQLKKKIFSK